MPEKKNILAIVGSASENSSNQKIVENIAGLTADDFNISIFNQLKGLPQFDPRLSADDPPKEIKEIRNAINNSDGVIICSPEYIFSIPSGLKNLIEWCVATTVFSDKPMGLITASLGGEKAHEELLFIMKTVMSKFTPESTLLIAGIKGKIDQTGKITDPGMEINLLKFIEGLKQIL